MTNIGKLNQAFDLLEYEEELEGEILRHQAEADQLRADCWELRAKIKDLEQYIERQDDLLDKIFNDLADIANVCKELKIKGTC